MKIMDRYLFFQYLRSFIFCFISLVGLYVIIDLFAQADEFLEDSQGVLIAARKAGKYYLFHSMEYFNTLSPILTQIAAMTTLASLHRNNEIVALLAAGIPTRRALWPVIAGAGVTIAFGAVNREFLIPQYSEVLQRLHEDIEANKPQVPSPKVDKNKVLISASEAYRDGSRLENVHFTLPIEMVGQLIELRAKSAYQEWDEELKLMGWRLVQPMLGEHPFVFDRQDAKLRQLPNGDLFLASSIGFADMIRKPNWMEFASTFDLIRELRQSEIRNWQTLRIRIHGRILQPALHMLLVLIGIPFVLQWEQRNIYRSIAVSMLLSAFFFVVSQIASQFATFGYVDPMTAAWFPVFIFTPVAFALFHKMGT